MVAQGALAWVGTWSSAPQRCEPANLPPPPGLSRATLRQFVRVSIGGESLRLKLSNAYGASCLEVTSARIALASRAPAIREDSVAGLRFAGAPQVTVPAGGCVTSDALAYALPGLAVLAITIEFAETPLELTTHPGSRTTSYVARGALPSELDFGAATPVEHWYFLTSIEVLGTKSTRALVMLGDSLTDGRGSTTDGNDRWPDVLSQRLRANPETAEVAVLNQGIGGNALLRGGLGPSALERFERDVLNQSGVRYLVLLEGVNDIGRADDDAIAQDLIAAYAHCVRLAHGRGVLVYGVPILPFGASHYFTPARERARQAVNAWIRGGGHFDAAIDLDAAVRNPSRPLELLPAYDTGDHLHLNPAGYRAMAEAVDLSLFSG